MLHRDNCNSLFGVETIISENYPWAVYIDDQWRFILFNDLDPLDLLNTDYPFFIIGHTQYWSRDISIGEDYRLLLNIEDQSFKYLSKIGALQYLNKAWIPVKSNFTYYSSLIKVPINTEIKIIEIENWFETRYVYKPK